MYACMYVGRWVCTCMYVCMHVSYFIINFVIKTYCNMFYISRYIHGVQGWCNGKSSHHLPPMYMYPALNYSRCHMWVEFAVGSHLAPRYFSGFSSFLPSTKTKFSKFQFDQDSGPAWKSTKADVASSLNIAKFYMYKACGNSINSTDNLFKVDDMGSGCPIFQAMRLMLKMLDKVTNDKSTKII